MPPKKSAHNNHRGKRKFTAATADKYELYELSVQSPEPDVAFLARVYKRERGRHALHFREDFSGTGALTAQWIKRSSKHTAEAFDIDPEPIAWGRARHFEPLGKAGERAILHQADVRDPSQKSPDVRCAQNFSYWIFMKRAEMLHYLRGCREDLARDGILVLDLFGGPESMHEVAEETEHEGFSYVWEQFEFWPVTHEASMAIHFRFNDRTEMRNAFTYRWRMWTMPELTDLLYEAGFARVDSYWEGTDKDGESGNGVYTKTRRGENDSAWVSYLVALK